MLEKIIQELDNCIVNKRISDRNMERVAKSLISNLNELFKKYIDSANKKLPEELRITGWKVWWTREEDLMYFPEELNGGSHDHYDLIVTLTSTGGKEQDIPLFGELIKKCILNEKIEIKEDFTFKIPSYLSGVINCFKNDLRSKYSLKVDILYANHTSTSVSGSDYDISDP